MPDKLPELLVEALDDPRRPWAAALLARSWGETRVVSRGRIHQADRLAGFVALIDGQPAGLLTYHIEGAACEIVTLDSLLEKRGVGTALIEAAAGAARAAGCTRLWLITTNDNTPALRFYQRRGFVLAALHRGAVEQSRRLKPSIPLTGLDGIPIRDEIELERALL